MILHDLADLAHLLEHGRGMCEEEARKMKSHAITRLEHKISVTSRELERVFVEIGGGCWAVHGCSFGVAHGEGYGGG